MIQYIEAEPAEHFYISHLSQIYKVFLHDLGGIVPHDRLHSTRFTERVKAILPWMSCYTGKKGNYLAWLEAYKCQCIFTIFIFVRDEKMMKAQAFSRELYSHF